MAIQVLLWVLYAAFWIGLWPLAYYLDSRLSGWRNLAAHYPGLAKEPNGGTRLKHQWVALENAGTSHRVIAVIHRDGIQVEMPTVLTQWFYPNLFLPWKDVVSASRQRGWWWKRVRLTLADAPDDPVTIDAALADRVFAFVGAVWSEEPVAQKCELPDKSSQVRAC